MNRLQRLPVLGVVVMSCACAALPEGPRSEEQVPAAEAPASGATVPSALPTAEASERNPAIVALLNEARSQRAAGKAELAAASLERALRIDARDPAVWLELARVHIDQGDLSAAGQFAEKARRLAGLDEAIAREADKILRAVAAQTT